MPVKQSKSFQFMRVMSLHLYRYIRQVSEICVKQYDGDIPDTFKGLVALPGVGPKMVSEQVKCTA
jgi:endonuclease III